MSRDAPPIRVPHLPMLGWAALALIILVSLILVVQIGSLGQLALHGSLPLLEGQANNGVVTFNASLKRDAQRVNNRSPFFVPPRPAPKPVAKPMATKPVNRPKPVKPGAPKVYAGPDIIAMMGESVWLDTGSRVPVGEEADGVRIISTQPPWGARVAWRGGEFDVSLFERTTDQFLTESEPDNDTTDQLDEEQDEDESDEPEDEDDA